jgi:hypothetical protein
MKKTILIFITVLSLTILLAGCAGVSEETPLTPAERPAETLPASVKQAVVGKEDYSGHIASFEQWYNSLIGSKFKGRTITKIITINPIYSSSGYVVQVFALVELD